MEHLNLEKILFNNIEEYNKLHNDMYHKIKGVLTYYVNSEYKFMKGYGVTSRQSGCTLMCIQQELEKVSKVAEGIRKNEFPTKPGDFNCQHCDYRYFLCPAWEED